MRPILIALTLLFAGAAAAQQPDLSQSGLVGNLENPTILTDPAQWPKQFHEAPALAEQVKAGKLPPVDQRMPQEPMVLKPLHSVGKYGGTWRRGFLGPGDSENGNRIRSADKLLFWDVTGTKIMPNVAKGWEMTPDGKRTTIFLRKGMKWSDGAPFTADDFVFWFEDMYQNKDLIKSPAPEFSVNGKPGRLVKIDETTVAFEFDEPHFLFPSQLAGDTQVGGGQSRLQSEERELGLYAPAHYLKKFLPKYSSVEAMNQQAKAAGFDNWAQFFKIKSDWRLNPDVPTLSAWRMVQPINGQTWALERNPYFWAIDTAGNQLPYIDKVQLTLAENPEVINLRAIAGEYDYMERFIDLAKLPVFLENASRGHYKVHLDPGFNGADSELKFNFAYRQDPEIQKWFANLDFRRALALGIDRDQINEAFFLGLGVTGTPIPADDHSAKPGRSVPQAVGHAGRQEGQCHAGCDRPQQEGRRGLPAAYRQWPAPAPADRRRADLVADLAAAGGDDYSAMARHRHLGRHAPARTQPFLHAGAQRPEPDGDLQQQRLGEPVSLHCAGAADGSAIELWRRRLRAMVCQQRCLRHQADRSHAAEGLRIAEQRRRPDRGAADRDRQGDMEAAGRPGMVDRPGRPVAGVYGHARGQ